MKNFFKMMLATIAGFFISLLILFILFIGIVSALVASSSLPVEVKSNSILKLTLNNEIVDRSPGNYFSGIDVIGSRLNRQDGLTEIINNIKKAKNDPNIKGIYLELSYIQAHLASIEEIRKTLTDFKKSGKFIIAYSEFYYTQGTYFLASIADKVYLNPEGGINFLGLRSEVMFYKGTLDKLGIEVQVFKHGKFKSYPEPYISDRMSDESKLQITKLLSSFWNNLLNGISEQRHISVKELNKLADRMIILDADSCKAHNFVDSLYFADQVYSQLLKLSGQKGKEPEFVSLSQYEKVPKKVFGKGSAKSKIAVVYAQGDVVSGNDDEGTVSSERISKALRDARTDSSVKAIVFRINSPGGSSLASEAIYREVVLASKVKPVVASMGDVAASGGYYIACAADTIVADTNTITGSIGVFGILPNAKEFFNKKLGITTDVAKTNEHSDFPTISRPVNAPEKEFMQFKVDKVYETFISRVAESRKLKKTNVDEIGQGRVWSGFDAKNLGLVDILGGLDYSIEIAAKMAKIDNYQLINLPRIKEPLEKLIDDISNGIKVNILKSDLGNEYKYIKQYKDLLRMKGIQTRLPYEINIY